MIFAGDSDSRVRRPENRRQGIGSSVRSPRVAVGLLLPAAARLFEICAGNTLRNCRPERRHMVTRILLPGPHGRQSVTSSRLLPN